MVDQDDSGRANEVDSTTEALDQGPGSTVALSRRQLRSRTAGRNSEAAIADYQRRGTHSLARAVLTLLSDDAKIGVTSSAATDRVVELLTSSSTGRHCGIVATNSLRHAELLAHAARRHRLTTTEVSSRSGGPPKLLLLGGQLDPRESVFHGPDTVAQLRRLRLDIAVVTATAVRAEGFTVARPPNAIVATALLRAATRRIVLVDSSCTSGSDAGQPVMAFADLYASDCILLSGTTTQSVTTVLLGAVSALQSPQGHRPSLVVV